jgi:hypothetical protein
MKAMILPVLTAALLLGAAGPAPTMQQWKAGWNDANKEYTQIPHATLKIQGDAYLHDGETAVLVGTKGNPTSYHFVSDPNAKGVLTIVYKGSQIFVMQDGKRLSATELTKSIPIDKDVDVSGQETQVSANVIGWRIFVYNQQNPQLKRFHGVIYYPYDPAWRITASFTPDPKLPARVFRTSRGTDKQFYHVGDAHFTADGKPVTLPLYGGSNDPKQIKDASAFFRDDLTGSDTYGAGRYVDVSDFGAFPPKTITIDFNDAYNPLCAISSHFTCPVAIDSIPGAVKAGERDSHFAH